MRSRQIPTLAFLVAAFSTPILSAQILAPQAKTKSPPRDLFEAVGFKMPETPLTKPCLQHDSSESPLVEFQRAGPQPLATVTTGQASPIPGTVVFVSNDPAVVAPADPGRATVFSETFTSGLASSKVLISFSAQGFVPSTTSVGPDGVYFLCTVTQGGPATACPATGAGPQLISQTNSKDGLTHFISYVGAVSIAANTSTTVEIKITTVQLGSVSAGVLHSTLMLMY